MGKMPYTFDALGMYECDDENGDNSTEARFAAGADADEGVSGRLAIDTSFENTSEDIVQRPRSGENAPQPVDLYRYPHRRC